MNDKADETDRRHPRQTWKGYDDAFARGIELVATPLLFGLGGWYLDRWAGTRPLFTLALFLVAIVGMAARMYFAYAAAMDEHERTAPWARRRASAAESGRGDSRA